MRQFDVFANPNTHSQGRVPYLVNLQNDLLDKLENVVVAPLRRLDDDTGIPVLRLNPVVTVEEVECFVRTQELAAISPRGLGRPVANLSEQREAILAALDLLFTGF